MAITEPDREPTGSNGISIAPSYTRDGNALLLINPHTSFYFRSEQHVTSREGLDVYGAATRGAVLHLPRASTRTPAGCTHRVPSINRFQRNDGAIAQTFDDAKPSIPVPFTSGRWGSLASYPGARRPGTKRFCATSGNTFVAVVEFGPRLRAWAVREGGASGHPESPHFNDQAERYASGNLRPVYFYPNDLKRHVERS